MHKQLINEFHAKISILPQGPILIGSSNAVAAGTDTAFVRTYREGQNQVYLPGSSLKGVLRAHAEKIGRTLNKDAICNLFNSDHDELKKNPSPLGVPGCNDTFGAVKKSRRSKSIPSDEAYRGSCPACRLFGSLFCAGRLNISDAYLDLSKGKNQPQTEYRDGVAIDRFSGGTVNNAKFDYEVITEGEFFAKLRIRNFELWQLSWVCYLLRDLEDEMISLGMGSSRGLGHVKGKVHEIQIDYLGVNEPVELKGVGALYKKEESQQKQKHDYGFSNEKNIPLPEGVQFQREGIRQRLKLEENQVPSFYHIFQDAFPEFIENFQEMQNWRRKNLSKRS